MSAPQLTYFDGPGRARLTRLAFAAGGVEFKDTRLSFSEWPAVKADSKSVPAQMFGSMPVIDHDGHMVAQSLATACYASELGIWAQGRLGSGAAAAKNRSVDIMVAATNEDLRAAMYKCLFGSDESKKAGAEALPARAAPLLEALERIYSRKTCSGPFFVSTAGPTLADLAVFDNVTSVFPGLKALGVDLTPYPGLNACVAAVAADERIAAYLAPKA